MTARAPYNFVPLPERVIDVREQFGEVNEENLKKALPPHDIYLEGRHSGYFDVTLTTESPLYVRGMLTEDEAKTSFSGSDEEKRAVKNKPDMFGVSGKVRIPGSSLRGMIRQIVEIITSSKMSRVSDKTYFYRDLNRPDYRDQITGNLGIVTDGVNPRADGYYAKVKGGFLEIIDGRYYIREAHIVRAEESDLLTALSLNHVTDMYDLPPNGGLNNPNQTPKPTYQYKEVWVNLEEPSLQFFPRKDDNGNERHPNLYLKFRKASQIATHNFENSFKGNLILTGRMITKHLHFVFIPFDGGKRYEIPNPSHETDIRKRLVDQFQDKDQITQWQGKAFPETEGKREKPGYLAHGDALFFLDDDKDTVTAFGRTQMFRMPFTKSPRDLLPSSMSDDSLVDFTEALFGFLRKSTPSYSGRINFTDAIPKHEIQLEEVITPPILSTPKPTSYQHYLKQTAPQVKGNYKHYDSGTQLRGFKLYWRQSLANTNPYTQANKLGLKNAELGMPSSDDTQRTALQAIARKQQFSFRVYFDNLTSIELGILETAINLPKTFFGATSPLCHQLGMGKPFGMGVIRLKSELHVIERNTRYKDLFSGWGAKSEPISTTYTDDFKQFVNQLGLTKHDERVRSIQTMLTLYEKDAEHEYMSYKDSKDRYRLDNPTEVSQRLTRSSTNAEKELELANVKYNVAEIGAIIRGKAMYTDEEGIWFVPANMENKEEEYDALIPNSEVIKWVKDNGRVKGEIIGIEDRERTTLICRQLED